MSARGPPPDWLSFLAALRPAHNDRADRPILRWQACRGQVNVKCSADLLLAHRALPDAIHPLHRRRPVAPPATPELLCLSVAVADEIRFACRCATLVVLRQSLTVAPRNLNAYAATIEVAGLKDSLHQVLGGLSLASAYWSRSIDATNGSDEDPEAADRALRHAIGAAEGVPDHLRPHARIAVAAVLAKCDQGEEALRVLELALQELSTDQSHGETDEEESLFSVTAHPWGDLQ